NIQLIHTFGAKGVIFGTALAVGTAVALNLWKIKSAIGFPFRQTFKRFMLVCIFCVFMVVSILIIKLIFGTFWTMNHRAERPLLCLWQVLPQAAVSIYGSVTNQRCSNV